MRPLRLPPKDNAVPANSANVPAAPPLLRIPANAPAAQGRHSSRAQKMQPKTVAQGQRHPCALFDNATAAFPLEDNAVPAPSVNSMWGEAMLMRNHIDCAKEPQAFWNHFICFVAQAPFVQTLQ